jgi:hypothetical protein
VITVIGVPEPGTYNLFEEGLIYPVPSIESNQIVLEERDGRDVVRIPARGVTVRRDGKRVAFMKDVKITVFITDARVAFACSKYDKGGGWIGGAGALVMNAGSMALAAIRRRGKMAVGQVRYPWISTIGSSSKMSFGSEEALDFTVKTPQGKTDLVLHLPKNVDAASLAAEIARRAAAYRLACEGEFTDKERVRLEELRVCQPLEPIKGKVHYHIFPTYWPISEKSARLMPGAARAASPQAEAAEPQREMPAEEDAFAWDADDDDQEAPAWGAEEEEDPEAAPTWGADQWGTPAAATGQWDGGQAQAAPAQGAPGSGLGRFCGDCGAEFTSSTARFCPGCGSPRE